LAIEESTILFYPLYIHYVISNLKKTTNPDQIQQAIDQLTEK